MCFVLPSQLVPGVLGGSGPTVAILTVDAQLHTTCLSSNLEQLPAVAAVLNITATCLERLVMAVGGGVDGVTRCLNFLLNLAAVSWNH